MLKTRFLFLCLICCVLWPAVVGNTEIVNIIASEEQDVDIPEAVAWPVLHFGVNEGRWNLEPAPLSTPLESVCKHPSDGLVCPHELWVTLDLDHESWMPYSKFTLRLSWPASSPTNFVIQIYNPSALSAHFLESNESSTQHDVSPQLATRRKYARIRLISTGVPTPSSHPPELEKVPFNLILEPLYLGVLPASVLPIVVFLALLVSLVGTFVVPLVNVYLEGIVREAKGKDGKDK